MRIFRIEAAVFLLLAVVALPALGQAVPLDSARCATALNTPTPDSALFELDAIVSPYDTSRKVPTEFRAMLGEGLREVLAIPHPLALDTYSTNASFMGGDDGARLHGSPSIRSFYAFTLHRDGRLTNIRVIGGSRNPAFDRAVLAAIATLDTTGLLPPPSGFDESFDHDTLPLRLTITPGTVVSTKFNGSWPRRPGVAPLLRMRVPVYAVEVEAAPTPDNVPPRYPPLMRNDRVEGKVITEFLVRADGTVDPQSIYIPSATTSEFAEAVIAVLPSYRFVPMRIKGCNVAAMIRMPFEFSLSR